MCRSILFAFTVCFAVGSPIAADGLAVVQTVCDIDFPGCASGVQGLRGARAMVVSGDGAHVYVPSSLDDALLAFSRSPGGGLTLVQSLFDTDPGIDGLDSARGAALSPDGEHVYVAALLDASVTVFDRDPGSGVLTFVEIERDGVAGVDGLAGAHGVAVSPDGAHVYVAARSDDAVAVFARNATTGALTFLHALFDGAGGVDGLDAAESLVVSSDGKNVYVAAELDDAVSVFERDDVPASPTYGRLTFVEAQFDGVGGVDGLNGAGTVAISPAGDNVYVASERTAGGGDWIAVFARVGPSGELSFVQDFDEEDFGPYTGCSGVGPDNSGIVVRPDGGAVYATNPFRGTVAWFDRAPATGSLTLHDAICDQNFGLDGIAGAASVSTDPTGRWILTASPSFETVAVLAEQIFADGFESGDTTAWSVSVP